MKVRAAIAGTRLSAALTILGFGTLTIFASAAVTACSGSPSGSAPSFSPGGTVSPSPSVSPSDTGTASPSPSASASASTSPTPSPTPTEHKHHHHSPSTLPTAAPATGGGGTAGLQDTLLFALGGAAVLAGAGTLAYRRIIIRKR